MSATITPVAGTTSSYTYGFSFALASGAILSFSETLSFSLPVPTTVASNPVIEAPPAAS
jgi:hypothetical protein